MEGKIMLKQAATIRAISYENDDANEGQSVVDIREFEGKMPEMPAMSFTATSRDMERRQLMMDLLCEVDRLLSGEVDEVRLFLIK